MTRARRDKAPIIRLRHVKRERRRTLRRNISQWCQAHVLPAIGSIIGCLLASIAAFTVGVTVGFIVSAVMAWVLEWRFKA